MGRPKGSKNKTSKKAATEANKALEAQSSGLTDDQVQLTPKPKTKKSTPQKEKVSSDLNDNKLVAENEVNKEESKEVLEEGLKLIIEEEKAVKKTPTKKTTKSKVKADNKKEASDLKENGKEESKLKEDVKEDVKEEQPKKIEGKKEKVNEKEEKTPTSHGKKRAAKKEVKPSSGIFDDDQIEDSEEEEKAKPVGSKVNERLSKLDQLRKRMKESSEANRKEVFAEFQRSKANPKLDSKIERQRLEAERLQARMEAQDKGEDYERSRYWEYSAEQVEKWEQKEREKEERSEVGFTDHMQAAERRYKRLVNKIKPNMAAYNLQKDQTLPMTDIQHLGQVAISSALTKDNKSVQYLPIHPKPSSDAVERLATHVKDEIAKRGKFSKIRPVKEDEDVTYINDRNAHFNRKISRAYDKYTKEIKENFERGTAL
ncbi:SYF2-domain-containing protein [Neoconidiobolus thromboides FSU 785]|nr:SYF2-domain-containing protein [Neoconidiobolus thromboides FSU 785]